jgi:apyrase
VERRIVALHAGMTHARCHHARQCRALHSGIIKDAEAKQQDVEPVAFLRAARLACSTQVSDIQKSFPSVSEDVAPYLCLDLILQFTLLTQGLKIPEGQKVTLVKQVLYRGDYYEAAWPLGAAINTLSA